MASNRPSTIHDPRYQQLIEALIDLRRKSKVSQIDLAKALELSQPDISKVERFVRRIDVLEFFDWAEALAALSNANFKELLDDLYFAARRPRQSKKRTQ
jgi:transcriptional regulator with XRE-family HTH domain